MLTPLDDERKQKICEMYKSGATLKEIREATGCHASMVEKIVKGAGLEPRRTYTKKTKVEHVCPKCRKHISVAGARFFPWCGADVRSERQIVAEELERVLGIVCDTNVPADSKDRACNTLRNAIRLLKEEAVE